MSIQLEGFGVIHRLSLSQMHLTSSIKEAWEFKDMSEKNMYSFISLLTLEVNVVRLNSTIPLTCVNFMWTQSWGTHTLGLANYWLITSSDTGHSKRLSQIWMLAHLCWQKLSPKKTLAILLNFINFELIQVVGSWSFKHAQVSSNCPNFHSVDIFSMPGLKGEKCQLLFFTATL